MTAEKAQPPVAKYLLTVTVRGNTHDEIVDELLSMTRGGYLLASDYYKRDEFDSTGGRDRMVLQHTNPDMTPERYREELSAWFDGRKAERRSPPETVTHPHTLDGECVAADDMGCPPAKGSHDA